MSNPESLSNGEIDPDLNNNIKEYEAKTKLIRFTYEEVLDATKHQDDKIGRFLTAIAFLTATAFALANLGQGEFLFRRFNYGHERPIHLTLFALTIFVLGVITTVLLLMSSFATPIRFPNLSREKDEGLIISKQPSTFYFNEIATLPLGKWEDRWFKNASTRLKKDTFVALVKETHNLSSRATLKYARMSEAASIFSLSLLAYAFSMLFIVLAANQKFAKNVPLNVTSPIYLDSQIRLYICLLFFSFLIIQLYVTFLEKNQAVNSIILRKRWNQIFLGKSVTIMLALYGLCMFTGASYPKWILDLEVSGSLVVHFLLSVAAEWFSRKEMRERAKKLSNWPIMGFAFELFIFVGIICLLILLDGYYHQLFLSVVLVSFVSVRTGLSPVLISLKRRREFYSDRSSA